MNDKIVGKTLETERKKANLKQGELASKAHVTRSKIAMVESYERELSTGELKRCASALGISECYLLTGNDDENRECAADELGLSNTTITKIKEMHPDTLKALELLINDPTFSDEWAAYINATDQGLWQNGRKIAAENTDVTVGNYGDFGGGYKVGSLVKFIREQNMILTFRNIRERVNGK